ncbi:integral membrane protein [Paraphaeosphaeria sporulosa]
MGFPTPAQVEYMTANIHEDRRHTYIVVNSIMLTAAYIAFVLRFVSRRLGAVKMGVDDWFMLFGMFLTTSYITMLFILLRFGMGRHIILVTDAKGLTIALITAEVLYAVSICFIKMSILSLYNRLFPQVWFTRTSIPVAVFIVLFTITKIGGDIFQCVPISSHWTPGQHATCIEFSTLVIVHGVLNIVTDFIIVGLPLPILWQLKLTTIRKWALTFMLAVGILVCVISVVRLPIVKEVDTPDPSWDFVWPLTISSIELCAAVIAACVPTYRPSFNLIVNGDPKRNTKTKGSYGTSRDANSSSFSNQQIPLSDVSHFKTDIYRGFSPRLGSLGYSNLDASSHGTINANQISVTRSFSYKESVI